MRFITAVINQSVVYEAVNNVVTVTDIRAMSRYVIIVKYI
jgi:hypothetical protein